MFAATAARQSLQSELPLTRQPLRVFVKCLDDPARLAIADCNESNMHELRVGRGGLATGAKRPQFLQVVELTHPRQHHVHQRVLQIQ